MLLDAPPESMNAYLCTLSAYAYRATSSAAKFPAVRACPFTPHTVLGKLFTIFYIFAGIGLFASAVATLARAMLKAHAANREEQ